MTHDDILDILYTNIAAEPDGRFAILTGIEAAADAIVALHATEQMATACHIASGVPEDMVPEVKDRLEEIFGTRLVDALFGAPK